MSIIRNPEDLNTLKHSAKILASCLNMVRKNVKPGISAGKLNDMAEQFIFDHQATPSFKGLYGYPHTLISEVNDEIVHGISPNSKFIPETCVVSFDCGVIYKKLYSDMCILMTVGQVRDEVKFLVEKTEESLWAGIKAVKAGKRVGDIGAAVDAVISGNGLGNVLDFGGHGLGYKPHDEPHIEHAGKAGTGPRLMENMVIAIEPMVSLGSGEYYLEKTENNWEVAKTVEGVESAHIEHTILVTKTGYEVLTDIPESEMLT